MAFWMISASNSLCSLCLAWHSILGIYGWLVCPWNTVYMQEGWLVSILLDNILPLTADTVASILPSLLPSPIDQPICSTICPLEVQTFILHPAGIPGVPSCLPFCYNCSHFHFVVIHPLCYFWFCSSTAILICLNSSAIMWNLINLVLTSPEKSVHLPTAAVWACTHSAMVGTIYGLPLTLVMCLQMLRLPQDPTSKYSYTVPKFKDGATFLRVI